MLILLKQQMILHLIFCERFVLLLQKCYIDPIRFSLRGVSLTGLEHYMAAWEPS